jgi:hypothetical protein
VSKDWNPQAPAEVGAVKIVWITTEEVVQGYGFDPLPVILELKSKLLPVGNGNFTRVWMEGAVQVYAERRGYRTKLVEVERAP